MPALQKLAKKYPIKMKVIGADFKIDNIDYEIVDWNEHTEIEELLSADIGIMPLANTIWEKGKCGFKLVQYMVCGLPVVASIAPANEEIIDNGVNGFLVSSEEKWYLALEKLILNASIREGFGNAGRKKIEQDYSYQVWGNLYCKLLTNCY